MWYSRFELNTYRHTLYFEAHAPADFPLDQLILATSTFHELPPRLRRLAELSREWAQQHGDVPFGIGDYYDAEGFELDPGTGDRATREQVLDERGGELPAAPAADIPEAPGGFADPATWQPPVADDVELVDRADLTEDQVLGDIASRGRDWTAGAYGLPSVRLAQCHTDLDVAAAILEMDGKPWPVVA